MEQSHSQLVENRQPVVILKINKTQAYAWGSTDENSQVAKMTNQKLNNYAQFWMGVHSNGQSKVQDALSLKQYLKRQNKNEIEFLFKILSIQKCLSIQVHPNQQEAKQLNKQFPKLYTDDKSKPQMFLTLSQNFQLFLGFLEADQIENLISIEPFKYLSAQFKQQEYKQKIIGILQKIVSLSQQQVNKNINILFQNLHQFPKMRQNITRAIFEEFKNDAGILVSFLLQYHILEKGSCFGIQAGVPHAYIKGQCLELMKNSDNVLRLGLTPKQKDIQNLLKVVKNNFDRNYQQILPNENESTNKLFWKGYQILQIHLSSQQKNISIECDSIGFITTGEVLIRQLNNQNFQIKIHSKTVFFIEPGSYFIKGLNKIYIACKY